MDTQRAAPHRARSRTRSRDRPHRPSGLCAQLAGDRLPALAEWCLAIHAVSPAARVGRFAPAPAERLAAVSRDGLDGASLLRQAAAASPLPDDHVAAALWWRVNNSLLPAVVAEVDDQQSLISG